MIIEIEQEADGRWIAEIPNLPGCMVYGINELDAVTKVLELKDQMVLEQSS